MIRSRNRRGITLIELLVVIAIIGTLLGLLLSAVQRARWSALRVQCLNNLKQIGLALHGYHNAYATFPPGCGYRNGADPYPYMSWQTRLLPFIEQQNLWKQTQQAFEQDRWFEKVPPHVGFKTVMPLYVCPADPRSREGISVLKAGPTSYLGNEGIDFHSRNGVLYLDSKVRIGDIYDGTSNTFIVGERPPSAQGNFGWWYAGWGQVKDGSGDSVLGVRELNVYNEGAACPSGPYHFGPGRIQNQCDAFHFWSLHFGGAHFLFADGSVHFLSYSADNILPALATRAGGEAAAIP